MRVFIGLDLPGPLREALVMQQFLLPLQRRVPAEDLHITLVFCEKLRDDAAGALHDALSSLHLPGFDLTLAGLGLFGGNRPHSAWAGVAQSDGLVALQAAVEAAGRRAGLDLPHRRFVPHVTLGRFARPDPATLMRLERGIAAGAGFAAGPWRVDEMVLWHSELTEGGPRYSELARYPFTEARRPPPGSGTLP
ncbi:RNA 2',3'-cyclic phosphodiesterase [Pseudogemmobacter bohemicus]|uniref:RNA 2',3'-cyclic phosphodiesterase n=1 Tax=Pseudogemmobacter bohemicus TaxID=2250708 RepID=UPI001E321B16|nr:RNA 2',3'-cyclic phosphodiesterase [Pseudogemmobacter bohemicus]